MHLPFNTKHIDKTYWILLIALVVVAILTLSSAGSSLVYARQNSLLPILQQVGFLVVGLVITYFLQFVPTLYIRAGGYGFLAFSDLCLWIMLIPGNPFVRTINDAGRWFSLFGFTFQPSELAKLSLIIVVADLLARIRTEEDKKRYFYITLGVSGFTIIPILLGNLSTAILLGGIVFLMWYLARIPAKYLGSCAAIAITTMLLGFAAIKTGVVQPSGMFSRASTWVNRIDHMDSKEDPMSDDNYQRTEAKIAVARGGKSPFGVLPGNSTERAFLPLAFADYIFAIFVEENGLVGAAFLILIYLAILFRSCIIGNRFNNYTAMLMVMGLALLLTCQALISMMVAVGLGPVTGQPLPLISKGGTSVIITCLYFGILMAVSREQKMRHLQEQEAKQQSSLNVPDLQLED